MCCRSKLVDEIHVGFGYQLLIQTWLDNPDGTRRSGKYTPEQCHIENVAIHQRVLALAHYRFARRIQKRKESQSGILESCTFRSVS